MTQPAAPRGRGTLSRRLVWRTTVLVAAVTIFLSALYALSTQRILEAELDSHLALALRQSPRSSGGGPGTTTFIDDVSASGMVRVYQAGGAARVVVPPTVQVSQRMLSQLLAVPTDGEPVTMRVDGLGSYRLLAARSGSGAITVVGLPMTAVTVPMGTQLLVTGLLVLVAIGGSYLGARAIVERSLRPLNRLAAAANTVSTLPLDQGEGSVPVRVAPTDTDPATEVGQVGLAFNHMLDNVERALAARHRSETKVRRFVADASHELRNPLASISGYTELTRRDRGSLPPDIGHALGRIEAESDRMSALVEDLLLLARLDSDPSLDRRPTDLTELVVNAVSDAQVAAPDDRWELDVPGTELVAPVDPNRLQQVVANLLANARTHTPPGTTVRTRLAREADHIVIAVCDDGPGIPAELLPTVFERFTRGDPSRVRRAGASSTGLGLAIVRAVVEAHGGTAELDSRPGRTCITIRLPRG